MTEYTTMPVPPGNGGWMPGPGGGKPIGKPKPNAILTIDPLKGQTIRLVLTRKNLSFSFIGNDTVKVQGGGAQLGKLKKLPGVQSAEIEGGVSTAGGDSYQLMP